jgi:hypothetical protein
LNVRIYLNHKKKIVFLLRLDLVNYPFNMTSYLANLKDIDYNKN